MTVRAATASRRERGKAENASRPEPCRQDPIARDAGLPRFLTHGTAVQARVEVGAVDDPLEQEAEGFARTVQHDEPVLPRFMGHERAPPVRRECDECAEKLPEEIADDARALPLQRQAARGGPPEEGEDEGDGADDAAGNPGAPLVAPVRARLEGALGLDLGHVRIHAGQAAEQAAGSLDAKAFTRGNHIWLGRRQRPDDLQLMAHEVAHVVQQGAAPQLRGHIQRAPADYRHPEDGGNVAARMQSRISRATRGSSNEDLPSDPAARAHQARSAATQIDRGELAAERAEIEPEARPDVDRPAAERPRVEQARTETQAEADSAAEPLAEGEEAGAGEPGTKGEGGEAASAADAAARLADQAFAEADARSMPGPATPVVAPERVSPVDAAGAPLPGDPDADARIAELATQSQTLRREGTRVRSLGREERANAALLQGNIALVQGGVDMARRGVASSQSHLAFRQQLAGQARGALAVSEQKAATVAAEAPHFSTKANEGKAESGPMASEASQLSAQNAANTPDDSEAAANAREQGGKMNQAASEIATTDDAVTRTREKAGTLGEDAARARETNTETAARLEAMDETLAATGDKLGQMSVQNAQARAELQALAGAPASQRRQAGQLEARGEALEAVSVEIEHRLHAVQRDYAQAAQAVPAEEEPEEPTGQEALEPVPTEPESEYFDSGLIQRAPEESAAAATASEAAAPTISVPPEPGRGDTAGGTALAHIEAPGQSLAPLQQAEGGTEAEGEPLLPQGPPQGAAATEPPPPPQRERVDLSGGVSGALPDWMTGVPAPNQAQREEAAAAAEQRRQAQIAEIEAMAGGRFEELSAADKMGIALRTTGRNLFGSAGNIRWPGWGHLAVGLVDPRGPLMGVVSGLGMMLSGGANLLSAEQWARDPLGNLLKSAADIATGLTVILGSITALAGVIIAIMAAITILSFGTAAPVTGPIIAFCTTVLTTVGGWTIAVGKVALVLQALVFIKNLIDAACAETAGELQSESQQLTENVGDAANVVLQMGMARAGQLGARSASAQIQAAGGGVRYAAQLGARTGVAARAGLGAAGRGLRAVPGAALRGVRALPGTAMRGARALPGTALRGARAVGRGTAAVPGLASRGLRAAGRGIGGGVRAGARGAGSLAGRGISAVRAMPGRLVAGARALPGRIAAAPGSLVRGIRGVPGRLRESFGTGMSRGFLVGDDIASLGMARSAGAEARAAVWAEARAPGGALAGEARLAGGADELAEGSRVTGQVDEAGAGPGRGMDETVSEPAPAREARVSESGRLPNEDLRPGQLRNEVDDLKARPERLEGSAPHRRRRMGQHEWREQPDGASFCRFSPTRICVDTPEIRARHLQRAEARLAEAEADAAERAARAVAARERAAARGELSAQDRALMQAEAEAADARALAARQRAANERRAATRLENQGRADEAAAARTRADAAMREFEQASGDAVAARQLLDEPAQLTRAAGEARATAAGAAREAEEAAGSLARQRALAQRLDDIAAEERAIMARNRHIEPPTSSPDGNRLRMLRDEADATRARLSGQIEAASGMTEEVRGLLRRSTPFKGAGGAARSREFLDNLPAEQRGPNGTFIDYVTEKARPLSELSPDHIVAVDEIFAMEGFGRLSRADQLAILDMPENLRMLSRRLNESKGNRSLSAWLGSEAPLAGGVTATQRQALARVEAQAREAVRTAIARRLQRMREL